MSSRIEKWAEGLYFAYGEDADFKNFQGNPMPEWSDLPPDTRRHWEAVTRRAVEFMTPQNSMDAALAYVDAVCKDIDAQLADKLASNTHKSHSDARPRNERGEPICGETDGLLDDEVTPAATCTRSPGHWEAIHKEVRNGEFRASWRQVLPGSDWEAARAKRFPARFGPAHNGPYGAPDPSEQDLDRPCWCTNHQRCQCRHHNCHGSWHRDKNWSGRASCDACQKCEQADFDAAEDAHNPTSGVTEAGA